MKILHLLLPVLLPLGSAWVRRHERRLLVQGVPLTEQGLADARRMGVRHPEKIRLMEVDAIPVLNGRLVKFLARFFPAMSSSTVGLSLRYGIYVRTPYGNSRRLVAHECVHTAQYERAGGIGKFLHAYFSECILIGYPDAPMEQEAILRAATLGETDSGY